MREHRGRALLAAVLLVTLVAGCAAAGSAATHRAFRSTGAGSTTPMPASPAVPATGSGAPSAPTLASPDRVHRLLARLTLSEKVRQLLVVSFSGTSVPAAMIRRVRPGGVIYFAENLVNANQVGQLSAGLQLVSRRAGLPLLIGTDQEGGSVTRLPTKVSRLPAGAQFHGNARWARRVAHRTGSAMRRMGLNLDFAPVADVNTVGDAGVIGDRSFGSTPGVVARLVRAQICGYHAGGVAATVKHFPGHGSTRVDSHLALPTLHLTRQQWRNVHLPPFRRGIDPDVDAVMVGHLAFPRLDPSGRPASLSGPMVTHWLRGRLGYRGVVVTDSLEMGAVIARGTSAQIAVRAIRAGDDLLLMSPHPGGAVRGLLEAVHGGRISVHRINQSVERVLKLKDRLGLLGPRRQLAQC